jgi:DNA helicase-2/ATP-dependent DNA helicase PcrA
MPGATGWPREVPLIQLLYELITWMPVLQNDPEGLIYLEVITRTITQSARFIAYDAMIRQDAPAAEASVKAILRGIFEPLASGAIDIDEDLTEVIPRDRLSIMSVHQAKGLEFPLTIVDVSSDFTINSWQYQGFKRFPLHASQDGIRSSAPILEDAVRQFSPLGKQSRSTRDREFDDLVRQFFVAFSRAQDVLMLVGLCDNHGNPRAIPNVATGWTRDGLWPLRGLPGITCL